ncbi:ImmA/IrrE family metallo-endopeptidase [uncultured Acinetobacter sp.]|uniref:ImmA/IrrE family metallo-endopeptidase n=1 Tax=uncultured Acinetobacter sp. TaxID=165433 RepID=UPI002588E8A2|nr:ImmA/IrrE family metallo-endopeptidase [uncultured Acinetobacter sp.]
MNTTKKGSIFEEIVFNYFNYLINNGYFGFAKDQCLLTRQKSYYSKDREKEIIFDLSLELFFPQQATPFLIMLIECKNYNKKVPIDDIEEFSSKVSQISAHKTKALCITTKGFQEGALTFSKNKGISLWRITQRESHEIILNRTKARLSNLNNQFFSALTEENYSYQNYGNIFIQTPLRNTFYPKELIKDMISDLGLQLEYARSKEKQNVPYRSKEDLENFAERTFLKFSQENQLDLEIVIQKYNFKIVKTNELESKDIIASLNFNDKTITIFGTEYFSNTQLKFALAHELAHILLGHGRILKTEQRTSDEQSINQQSFHGLAINIDRIEFQANYFAACLLLPRTLLKKLFIAHLNYYGIKNRGFSPLFIDNQPCNIDNYFKIIIPLAKYFNVSQETIKIRLEGLGLAKFD